MNTAPQYGSSEDQKHAIPLIIHLVTISPLPSSTTREVPSCSTLMHLRVHGFHSKQPEGIFFVVTIKKSFLAISIISVSQIVL